MSYALAFSHDFTVLTCCAKGCGVSFGVPAHWERKRREDHSLFFCPNGHEQYFPGLSDAEKLKRELEAAEKSKQYWREQSAEYERRLKGQRAATKRFSNALRKTKERLSVGVCPCCNRTFQQLARHMKSKHPDYSTAHEPGELGVVS